MSTNPDRIELWHIPAGRAAAPARVWVLPLPPDGELRLQARAAARIARPFLPGLRPEHLTRCELEPGVIAFHLAGNGQEEASALTGHCPAHQGARGPALLAWTSAGPGSALPESVAAIDGFAPAVIACGVLEGPEGS